MKKHLLILFAVFSVFSNGFSQVASITPATGLRGQTLTTTITMTSGLMATSTGPWQSSDVYLQQGPTIIYCTSISWPAAFDPILMRVVYADSGNITFTIPANAPNGYYDVMVNTYPLNFPILNTLSNGFFIGAPAGTIQGHVYFDQDQDGVYDAGELPVSNQRIQFAPNNDIAFTNGDGEYTYYADSGTYVVDYITTPAFTQTSPITTYTETVPPSVTGKDFETYSASNLYINHSTILRTRYRCNLDQRLLIEIRNDGFLPTRHKTTIWPNNFSYVSSTIPPDVNLGSSQTWITPNLGGGESFLLGGVMFCATPPAGNMVIITMIDSIFDLSGNFIERIRDDYDTEVRCAYDPNDKHVSPEGVMSQHYTPMNSALTYHINFQNTGNDTAYDVHILDTLDSDLDFTTLEIIGSSHTVNPQMTTAGAIRFNFFNIMLPDSNVDEAGSHGWVTYRISPRSGLSDPTVITNTSYIIFDQNVPVVTNTTMNTLTSLQYPQALFTTDDQTICETDCIQFTNQSTSGTSYTWIFTGGIPAISSSASPAPVCYSATGNYPVTLITTNALGSDTLIQFNYINVDASPGVFLIVQSGDSLIAPQGYDSYQWYYNNVLIANDTLFYHVATQDGDYGVVVGNTNGCQTGVNVTNFNVGLNDFLSMNGFDVYPNPSNGTFEISINSISENTLTLSILDIVGNVIMEEKVQIISGSNKVKIHGNNLSSGIYNLKLTNEKGVASKKLVINK